MYEKYEKQLKQECGINYPEYVRALSVAGNTPGVYTDVAYLLYKLAASEHVNSILEFGSGMSTCILAKAAQDTGKEFHAMEHMRKWYDITAKCMDSLGIPLTGYVSTDSDPEKFSVITNPMDLVWIDGPIAHAPHSPVNLTICRLGAGDLYKDQIKDAVLLFDDAQVMPNIHPWLEKFGRDKELCMWFNPTGRIDRHIYISFPAADHPLKSVIEACKL
jgi:hypothetical protein